MEALKSQVQDQPGLAFVPLDREPRHSVDTATAAYHLGRKPNTLRIWACKGGPISPVRMHGRLTWPVAEIRRVLGVAK